MDERGLTRPGRRELVRQGLAGLLLPLAGRSVATAASDHGPVVTPNPIKARIATSSLAVELVDLAAPPPTSAEPPHALLNFLYHAGDGSGRLFTNDTRGVIWQIDPKSGAAQAFLDLRPGPRRSAGRDHPRTGLRSFAFHPDFARKGAPGSGQALHRHDRDRREPTRRRPALGGPYPVGTPRRRRRVVGRRRQPDRVDPGSRRELFRVAQLSAGHCADQLMFDPNARPGDRLTARSGSASATAATRAPGPLTSPRTPGWRPASSCASTRSARRRAGVHGAGRQPVRRQGRLPAELGARPAAPAENLRPGSGRANDPDGHRQGERRGGEPRDRGRQPRLAAARGHVRDEPDQAERPLRAAGGRRRHGFTYPVAQYDHDEGRAVTGGFVHRRSPRGTQC